MAALLNKKNDAKIYRQQAVQINKAFKIAFSMHKQKYLLPAAKHRWPCLYV
jgi:hypothetical protein